MCAIGTNTRTDLLYKLRLDMYLLDFTYKEVCEYTSAEMKEYKSFITRFRTRVGDMKDHIPFLNKEKKCETLYYKDFLNYEQIADVLKIKDKEVSAKIKEFKAYTAEYGYRPIKLTKLDAQIISAFAHGKERDAIALLYNVSYDKVKKTIQKYRARYADFYNAIFVQLFGSPVKPVIPTTYEKETKNQLSFEDLKLDTVATSVDVVAVAENNKQSTKENVSVIGTEEDGVEIHHMPNYNKEESCAQVLLPKSTHETYTRLIVPNTTRKICAEVMQKLVGTTDMSVDKLEEEQNIVTDELENLTDNVVCDVAKEVICELSKKITTLETELSALKTRRKAFEMLLNNYKIRKEN